MIFPIDPWHTRLWPRISGSGTTTFSRRQKGEKLHSLEPFQVLLAFQSIFCASAQTQALTLPDAQRLQEVN